MPETSIDEESDLGCRPGEIRGSGDRPMPTPSREPFLPKQVRDPELGALVPTRLDRGHDPRATGRGGRG
jgi:hypothetical protein